ncbi:hypothetical protein GCM10011391_31160 [Pullulanibacillus camelliae]|uniref:Uracil-DNA glycosylase-like domain-containing protein n=1 Tax=Pullulanibacillus camelliae TaxID=1707096 RepID=A0A8J2YK40_9BACL|nr:hypothetical protein [Pullulanibacillus camelliae]GGE50172.1 hypothetical protein GCM10011391_31160 [Pullulanibacillus camelliae]
MQTTNTYFDHFLPYIKMLPSPELLQKKELLHPRFLLEKSEILDMYYAPHNEYINKHAQIVIVGITPGWTQMKLAFQEAKARLDRGDSIDQVLKGAKMAARFAGTMRKHLIEMLDECEVNKVFGLHSCRMLFDPSYDGLHTTSVIKYPVFKHGKNYTGYAPSIDRSPLLEKFAYHVFPEEIKAIEHDVLVIPLGQCVNDVIKHLIRSRRMAAVHCLFGFPHPSGSNGHRKQQWRARKSELISLVKDYDKKVRGGG